MDEKFCLKWNDFQENVQAAFSDLRGDLDYADVTLACEDQTIEAHKVILSICSPFFRDILKKNQHPHPLIYMRGLNPRDLTAVLDFIYHGEVKIAQEDLDGFLALAEEMQLKGLTGNDKEPENQAETQFHQKYLETKEENNSSPAQANLYAIRNHEGQLVSMDNQTKSSNEISYGTQMDIEAMMYKNDGRWNCKTCKFNSKDKSHLREHVQAHMDLEFPCSLCGKILRSSHVLRMHNKKQHSKSS